MDITTRQIDKKYDEDSIKGIMKPCNVRSGYFAGYRRALKDIENLTKHNICKIQSENKSIQKHDAECHTCQALGYGKNKN